MHSPSSELSAYIIEHKAQKLLKSSLNSSGSSQAESRRSNYSLSSQKRSNYLKDVLMMPKRVEYTAEDPFKYSTPNSKHDHSSVSKWLDEIDRRISERFPINVQDINVDAKEKHSSSNANRMRSDSLASICSCVTDTMSYDSHPNMSQIKLMCTKETYDLGSNETIKNFEPSNLCESCKQERTVPTTSSPYRTSSHEKSIPLPDGYKLIQPKKPKSKSRNRSKVKKPASDDGDKTPTPSPDATMKNHEGKIAQSPPVEDGKVMELLEKAIGQLNEVKFAVEENTVMECFKKLELAWSQGYSGNPLMFIDRKTAITTCGCMMRIMDTTTGKEQTFRSGLHPFGVVAVDPRSSLIAYATKKLRPTIEVIKFPELEKVSTLEGGCIMEYERLAFAPANNLLLSLSGIPDFMVTLWDVTTGKQLASVSIKGIPGNKISFNPLSWRQFVVTGDQALHVGRIELIDGTYHLKIDTVDLPKPDVELGVVENKADLFTKKYKPLPILAAEDISVASTLNPLHEKYLDKLKRVAPISHCWSYQNSVFIGCTDGQILLFNLDTSTLKVLANPKYRHSGPYSLSKEKLYEEYDIEERFRPVSLQDSISTGDLEAMLYNQDGLYVCGSTQKLKLIDIDSKSPCVIDCRETKFPISTMAWSTVYDKILLGSPKGVIYSFFPSNKNADLNVVQNLKWGKFVGAVFIAPGSSHIASARANGIFQIWTSETSELLSNLMIRDKVTAITACPSSRTVILGTQSGCVYIVDVSVPDKPRLVNEKKVHNGPVCIIECEASGHLFFTASEDGHVIVLDTRATEQFKCLANIDIPGKVKSVSTVHQLKVEKDFCYVAIAAVTEGKSTVTKCKIPIDFSNLPPNAFNNQCYRLSADFIGQSTYTLDYICTGLGLINPDVVVGIDAMKKQLVFADISSSDEFIETDRVPCHLVKGGSVKLSSHKKWIATSSEDGQVVYRTDKTKGEGFQVPCHSHFSGGVSSVAFTNDGQKVITTGKDGVIAFWKWNYEEMSDSQKAAVLAVVDYNRARYASLLGLRKEQDSAIKNLATIVPEDLTDECTWLESVEKEVQEVQDQSYEHDIDDLKKKIDDLRATVLGMIETNEKVDAIEKMKRHEFTLDVDERQRLLDAGQDEIDKIKEDVELENLAMLYLREIIKKECWDGMETKGKALCLFNGDLEVSNFPVKAQTEEEVKEVERILSVHDFEQLEKTELNYQLSNATQENDSEVTDEEKLSAALFGSHALKFYPNSVQNDQFQLHSNKRKRDQIILIQNTIRALKKAFNKEFDDIYVLKKQEISRASERLERVRKILTDLKSNDKVEAPTFKAIETPEWFLVVEDSEIKIKKYLSPEEEAARAEAERLEEERRRLANADNARERALYDMMYGKLEIRPEDELQKDLEKPEFMLKRPEDQWTEDEIKIAKEFEKKEKHLMEEREKYRKGLEAELKKIQNANSEAMASFDEKLQKLFKQRIMYQKTINQEELKIVRLARSVYQSATLKEEDSDLYNLLEEFKNFKLKSQEEISDLKKISEKLKEDHEVMQAEDKAMEKAFKKDFSDLDIFALDMLSKLYRRRPKLSKQKSNTETMSRFPLPNLSSDESDKAYFEALAELDSDTNKPESIDDFVWERFIEVRRTKVENELFLKKHGQQLADLNNYLQRMVEEDEKTKKNIEDTFQKLNDLRDKRLKFIMNLEVQLLLKQGQIEVDAGIFSTEYSDALLIHRSVVEDLNSHIVTLGEAKVSAMIDCKDYYKNIHLLEWEHEQMQMEGEDLLTRTKEVQTLRVTKELQVFLFEDNTQQRMQKEVQTLEKTIKLNESMFQKKVKDKKRCLERLNRMIAEKENACKELDNDLKELAVSLVERQQIQEASGGNDILIATEQRMKDIVARRKLVELAKSQSQEVAVLRAEVERLRMKTFPALVQNI